MKQTAWPLKDVLKEVIKNLGGPKRLKQQNLLETVWQEVVGTEIARQTKVVGAKQRVIRVQVDSATLLNELANFRKEAILSKIRERLPDKSYQDIKFIP